MPAGTVADGAPGAAARAAAAPAGGGRAPTTDVAGHGPGRPLPDGRRIGLVLSRATGRVRCTTWSWPPFRIDRYAVTNRQFADVRRRHRLADRCRAVRVVLRLRRTAARRLPAHAGRRGCTLVAPGHGGGLAPSRGTAVGRRRIGRTIPSSTSRGTTRRPTAPGRGPDCPPRPNGRWRPGVASTVSRSPGATSSNLAGSHRMNVFQGSSPAATPVRTATSAPPRSMPSTPTATASTT